MVQWRRLFGLLLFFAAAPNLAQAGESIDFTRDIRPILSNACFLCHGPDDENRKAELRLDTKEGALGNREGAVAIVPGRPDESEALLRMISTDPAEKMPPPKSGKKLTPAQIDLVRRWI